MVMISRASIQSTSLASSARAAALPTICNQLAQHAQTCQQRFAGSIGHSLSQRHRPLKRARNVCSASPGGVSTGAEALPAELQKIVTTFSAVPDAKLKYQQLLFLGKKLAPLPASAHTEDNKVRGCVSQVWVLPEVKGGKIYWLADSDSMLTKGLAALLVQGLNGSTPEEVVRIQPEFIEKLGLGQALTPSRNNGFLNMFKLMQAKALQLLSSQ